MCDPDKRTILQQAKKIKELEAENKHYKDMQPEKRIRDLEAEVKHYKDRRMRH